MGFRSMRKMNLQEHFEWAPHQAIRKAGGNDARPSARCLGGRRQGEDRVILNARGHWRTCESGKAHPISIQKNNALLGLQVHLKTDLGLHKGAIVGLDSFNH